MKSMLLLAAAMVSGAALAEPAANSHGKKHDGLICREFGETGSRLASKRVCMTKQQWDDSSRDARDAIDRAQTSQTNLKGG